MPSHDHGHDHVTDSPVPPLLSRRAGRRAGGLATAMATATPLGSVAPTAAGAQALPPAPGSRVARNPEPDRAGLGPDIMEIFQALPGTKGLNGWAPAAAGRPAWAESLNAGTPRFIASASKPFVLAAYLLQMEDTLDPAAPLPLREQIDARMREETTLDDEVFSPSSPVFNPPALRGQVTAQTVLDAMIGRSDNTATDIALRLVGPDRVRQLIAELGLANTRIPDSTRQMFGWVYGDPDRRTITWPRLVALGETDPFPHRPLLNDAVTMASTPNELVAF